MHHLQMHQNVDQNLTSSFVTWHCTMWLSIEIWDFQILKSKGNALIGASWVVLSCCYKVSQHLSSYHVTENYLPFTFSQHLSKSSSSSSFSLAISSLTPPLQLALSSHHIVATSLLHLMRGVKGKSGVAHSLLMSHLYWIYLRPINQPTPVTTSYFRPPKQTETTIFCLLHQPMIRGP